MCKYASRDGHPHGLEPTGKDHSAMNMQITVKIVVKKLRMITSCFVRYTTHEIMATSLDFRHRVITQEHIPQSIRSTIRGGRARATLYENVEACSTS